MSINIYITISCHGTGKYYKKGKSKNCKDCYKHAGICYKCGGTGYN